MEPKKLKRIVIKEELVMLTGDYKLAVVLNQMIYWSERRKDTDKFIDEEKERYGKYSVSSSTSPNMEISHGWIYKKAEELAEETMIGVSKKTMLNYLDTLTQKGWLHRRRNPKLAMDKTYQYRVDLVKIQNDLFNLGYSLDGYSIENTKLQNENSVNTGIETLCSEESPKYCNLPFETPRVRNETPRVKNETAIPEITTEITTENDDDAFHPAADILLKHNIVLSEKNPATQNCLKRLKGFTPEEIEAIARVLKEKEQSGKIKNAAGLLVKDTGICDQILSNRFYPDQRRKKNTKKQAEQEYEIFIPPMR